MLVAVAEQLDELSAKALLIQTLIGDLVGGNRPSSATLSADLQEADRLHQTLVDLASVLQAVAEGRIEGQDDLAGLEAAAKLKSVVTRLASGADAPAGDGAGTLTLL